MRKKEKELTSSSRQQLMTMLQSRCGKMGESGLGRINRVDLYFSNNIFFFFFQLQKQINDNLFRENE